MSEINLAKLSQLSCSLIDFIFSKYVYLVGSVLLTLIIRNFAYQEVKQKLNNNTLDMSKNLIFLDNNTRSNNYNTQNLFILYLRLFLRNNNLKNSMIIVVVYTPILFFFALKNNLYSNINTSISMLAATIGGWFVAISFFYVKSGYLDKLETIPISRTRMYSFHYFFATFFALLTEIPAFGAFIDTPQIFPYLICSILIFQAIILPLLLVIIHFNNKYADIHSSSFFTYQPLPFKGAIILTFLLSIFPFIEYYVGLGFLLDNFISISFTLIIILCLCFSLYLEKVTIIYQFRKYHILHKLRR